MTCGLALAAWCAGCGSPGAASLGAPPTGAARSSPAATASGSAAAQAGPSGAAGSSTGPGAASGPAAVRKVPVQAWLLRAGQLFSTSRSVAGAPAVGTAALQAMLAGPTAAERAAGVTTAIPAGTRLLGLRIAGGVATVNLSSSFAAGSGIPTRLAQVIYTVTQFSSVSQVHFAIDGTLMTTVGGVPVQTAQARAAYASFLPPITVSAPLIGQGVRSPVTVSGTADVFEAVVSYRVLSASGAELARGFTMASCGTGCRGSYSVSVAFTVTHAQPGTIEVYEVSAKDGTAVHVQDIPVTLLP